MTPLRPAPALLGLVVVLAILSGCRAADSDRGGSGPAATTDGAVSPTSTTSASRGSLWGPVGANGRRSLVGFTSSPLHITGDGAPTVDPCVLVAATDAQRQRGLMDVTDAELGGHAGMIFVFDGDTSGGFWMKDTKIPLSIAFADAGGTVVSTADMVPCPPNEASCPVTNASAPYRTALEVPVGALPALGIRPGSRLEVRPGAC